eukprot:360185-Chlamydomonas_euryale.AAC.1
MSQDVVRLPIILAGSRCQTGGCGQCGGASLGGSSAWRLPEAGQRRVLELHPVEEGGSFGKNIVGRGPLADCAHKAVQRMGCAHSSTVSSLATGLIAAARRGVATHRAAHLPRFITRCHSPSSPDYRPDHHHNS